MRCDHKFIDSVTCLKCGKTVREIEAEEYPAVVPMDTAELARLRARDRRKRRGKDGFFLEGEK